MSLFICHGNRDQGAGGMRRNCGEMLQGKGKTEKKHRMRLLSMPFFVDAAGFCIVSYNRRSFSLLCFSVFREYNQPVRKGC